VFIKKKYVVLEKDYVCIAKYRLYNESGVQTKWTILLTDIISLFIENKVGKLKK